MSHALVSLPPCSPAPATTSAAVTPRPPLAPGLPLLGSLIPALADPLQFFVRCHRQLGPAFRFRALGQEYTVIGGREANEFIAQRGKDHLSSASYQGICDTMGARRLLTALDGEEHAALRRVMVQWHHPRQLEARCHELIDMFSAQVDAIGDAWQPAGRLFRRSIVEQIGWLLSGRNCGGAFDALATTTSYLLNVHVAGRYPGFALRLPRFRRARDESLAFAASVVHEHRHSRRPGQPRDLVDALLDFQSERPDRFADRDLLLSVFGLFLAGMDTEANTFAFMLYALGRDPDLLARCRAEADTFFAHGPTIARLADLDVLPRVLLETLRRYPVVPLVPRRVERDFQLGGASITAGERVLCCTTLTHFLDEHFPDPLRFDIDRFAAPRNEHHDKTAFAPYALGHHACAARRMAEAHLLLLMLTLLHRFDFQLRLPRGDLRIHHDPVPRPGAHFVLRKLGRRTPPEARR